MLTIFITTTHVKTMKLKIKTEDGIEDIVNFRNQTDGNDYMEMKVDGGKSVNVGDSVDMSCSSGDRISKCYFFHPGGKVRYEVGPGFKFPKGRIGCLCDVRHILHSFWLR